MKKLSFPDLVDALEFATPQPQKQALIAEYFATSSTADAGWAVALFQGFSLKRRFTGQDLFQFTREEILLPDWLIEESHALCGDSTETLAHLWPPPEISLTAEILSLSDFMTRFVLPVLSGDELKFKTTMRQLPQAFRYCFLRMVTGQWRLRLDAQKLALALSVATSCPAAILSVRLEKVIEPTPEAFCELVDFVRSDSCPQPVAFPQWTHCPSDDDFFPSVLASISHWHVEWKWDGLRVQLTRQKSQTYLWALPDPTGAQVTSVGGAFPSLVQLAQALPEDILLEGDLVAWQAGAPCSIEHLQKFLKGAPQKLSGPNTCRKLSGAPGPGLIFFVRDIIVRSDSLPTQMNFVERREWLSRQLEHVDGNGSAGCAIVLQDSLWSETPLHSTTPAPTLCDLQRMCEHRAALGLLFKNKHQESWHFWKRPAHVIKTVLLYVQQSASRSKSDFTFGVLHDDTFVPVARIAEQSLQADETFVQDFIRKNTVEKFGPVRVLKPKLVFELEFESVIQSKRHKSGVLLRQARIVQLHIKNNENSITKLKEIKALIPLT